MAVSIFELFSIGLGPSSSHTVGPMRAAHTFATLLEKKHYLSFVQDLIIELYGSLAYTGKGHRTDIAVMLGLEGYECDKIDSDQVEKIEKRIHSAHTLHLLKDYPLSFDPQKKILFSKSKRLPLHSNAMRFTALDKEGKKLISEVYYSIGGGFVLDHNAMAVEMEKETQKEMEIPTCDEEDSSLPFPFTCAKQLLHHCENKACNLSDILYENEKTYHSPKVIKEKLMLIYHVMKDSVERGLNTEGILPGGLNVRRRAKGLYEGLKSLSSKNPEGFEIMDWISAFAIAVNEENAAGGRVVTAPTNGAAGVIPAVMLYIERFISDKPDDWLKKYLFTTGAIGLLYKEGASLSAAEVGCQGEVGVASSMAAAGLAEVMGGSIYQVENAAEIAMEHHLGLTCDPIKGLVQIPCIERNSMGAIKAINAARLALKGDGKHIVSLDKVIKTMLQTGKDMQSIYKETSEGGLAVGIIEC